MQLGTVIGHATATVKHPTLIGWRLLVVQPMDNQGAPDGEPQIALDNLGGGKGDRVLVTADGAAVREMVGSNVTPARWIVIGLADD
ncbi:MAG: eutN 1 [Planctomycetaceae bacterium]|nr:eutN 1 [Planctomycetaceae bacterium]